ncbi:MAG: hypothetical protein K2J39_08745 [Ruminococcus sp.]|nr:hypothetical protein [Ruminococcus sp.]
MNMMKQQANSFEEVLKNRIGDEIVVSYNYTGNSADDSLGYDWGILIEVGSGYLILDTSKIDGYLHNTTVVNLANVTSVYLDKRN